MKKISLIIVLSIFSISVFSQTIETKANFLLNFCRMLSWPNAYESEIFEIDIIGEAYSQNEIEPFLHEKTVFGKKIITRVITIANIDDGNILYVPTGNEELLSEIYKRAKGSNIIVITESPDHAKTGAAISLMTIEDEYGNQSLSYQFNEQVIKEQKVKISVEFKGFGVSVNPEELPENVLEEDKNNPNPDDVE